ncbi:DUF2878 domain-containing protein [Ideonella sp. BN130291]|uniref:DUF2878 domain-containing protein n=1 Tax=Ideonella sp. BN130291 TaxID=3112940 RepID=UPI002E2670BD|nr:DUF2878 domain-containing protein [Ideonella sp. BN130291]
MTQAVVAAPARLAPARVILNAAGFQLGWFACVLGAARGEAALGTGVAALLLALHVATAPRRRQEALLIGGVVLLGFAWDSALAAAGIVRYDTGVLLPGTAPYWIGALWALFAATLNSSMRWIRHRWRVALAFGALGGPLSFWAGVRLGAAAFPDTTLALAALSLGWAVWMPLLVHLAARLDRSPDVPARAAQHG